MNEQAEYLTRCAVDQRPGPKSISTVGKIIEALRTAAFDRNRSTPDVIIAMPPHVALLLSSRLEMTEDRMAHRLALGRDVEDLVEKTSECMQEQYMRFAQATCDLELLLMEFIGRPPMTMEEVREQQKALEPGGAGPQPFIRGKRLEISHELLKSIRGNKIGNPRNPGEDG